MNAPQKSTIDVDGLTTTYLSAGPDDGPIVLLLHDGAWGGSATVTWKGVLPYLTDRFRVVAPDLLGFGESAKSIRFDSSPYGFRGDHVLGLLRALGISEPVHVVGSSFGGSLALNMLAAADSPFASVMSISGTGGPWRSETGRRILGRWDGTESMLREIVAVLARPSTEFDLEEHLADRGESARRPGHYRAMTAPAIAIPEALGTPPSAAELWPQPLAGYPAPVRLVHGTQDVLVDSDWMSHLMAVLPNCSVIEHDGLHSPNLDAPGYTARLITEWVDSNVEVQHA